MDINSNIKSNNQFQADPRIVGMKLSFRFAQINCKNGLCSGSA